MKTLHYLIFCLRLIATAAVIFVFSIFVAYLFGKKPTISEQNLNPMIVIAAIGLLDALVVGMCLRYARHLPDGFWSNFYSYFYAGYGWLFAWQICVRQRALAKAINKWKNIMLSLGEFFSDSVQKEIKQKIAQLDLEGANKLLEKAEKELSEQEYRDHLRQTMEANKKARREQARETAEAQRQLALSEANSWHLVSPIDDYLKQIQEKINCLRDRSTINSLLKQLDLIKKMKWDSREFRKARYALDKALKEAESS